MPYPVSARGWATSAASAFDPLSLSPYQWLDFSVIGGLYQTNNTTTPVTADGETIGYVTDKSGNGRHKTQASAGSRPLWKANIQNSLGACLFSTDTLVSAAAIFTDDSFSVFVVARGVAQSNTAIISQTSGAAGRMIMGSGQTDSAKLRLFFNNGSSRSAESTTTAFDDTAKLMYWHGDGSGNYHMRINGGGAEGAITGQALTPENIATKLGVGTDTSANVFAGYQMEVFVFQPVLSSGDITLMRDYLNTKWVIF